MSDNTGSAKKIGLFTATMLAIGTIIGSVSLVLCRRQYLSRAS